MSLSKKMSLIALTCIVISLAITTVVSAQDYWDEYYDYTDEAWSLFGVSALICGIFVLVWFIIFIAIAIWVYKDAEKRGSSGALWLIIVILLGIIGIIIWLIIRPPIGGHPQRQQQATGRICTNCGRPIPMDAQICPYCGKSFQQK